MISWSLLLFAMVLVLGGLFAVLVIFSLSRSATGATWTGRLPGWIGRWT